MADDIIWDDAPAEEVAWDMPAPEKKKKPPLFKRSLNRLQLGLSDTMSTLAGDTYGRSGDPTELDWLAPNQKVTRVLGRDVIPAVSEVAADAVISGGKAILPQRAEDAISGGVNYVTGSRPAQALGRGLEAWKAASPDTYTTAGELGNIAMTKLPVVSPKLTGAARNAKALERTLALKHKNELLRRFEPAGSDVFDYGMPVEGGGLLKPNTFQPNKYYSDVIDEVEATPGVLASNSHTVNRKALADRTTEINQRLVEKLKEAPPLTSQQVDDAMLAAQARAADKTLLAGDANAPAARLKIKFDELMTEHLDEATGTIRPEDLLEVRRKLDSFVENAKMADPFTDTGKAANTAVREMRQEVNNLVASADPSIGVKTDLDKMSKLLTARDIIAPRSLEELNTNSLTRALRRVEEKTGFRHPVSPLAAQANISHPAVSIPAAIAAVATHSGGKIAGMAKKGTSYMDVVMSDLLRSGIPAAQRSVIIDTINREKERENN